MDTVKAANPRMTITTDMLAEHRPVLHEGAFRRLHCNQNLPTDDAFIRPGARTPLDRYQTAGEREGRDVQRPVAWGALGEPGLIASPSVVQIIASRRKSTSARARSSITVDLSSHGGPAPCLAA
jgi:hypothetical protein